MTRPLNHFDTPPAPALSVFEEALRVYADALATHHLAIQVHARCHGWRARERAAGFAFPRSVPAVVAHPRRGAADHATPATQTSVDQLTARQIEVVKLISRGCTNAEIADALVVTRGTAANHVAAILTRLGVANRTQVAAWAIAAGLIEP